MKKTEQYCIEDNEYSLTECFFKYIHDKIGCQLFGSKASVTCTTKHQLQKMRKLLLWIKETPTEVLQKETGCLYKCTQTLVGGTILDIRY